MGGGCLSKDPYILLDSAGDYQPFLVGRARELNEFLPVHVAETVVRLLSELRGTPRGLRLAVLGWAYKGWPPTDDMRGTPIRDMMPIFSAAGITVTGHDPMVTDDVIRQYGGEPISMDKAFTDSDAVLVINDHPDYRTIDVAALLGGARPALIFDSWRILDGPAIQAAGIRYAGLGYLPAAVAGGAGMRALLLGGAGFIGLHLCRRLVADGHEVTIVDDFSRGREDADLDALRAHPSVDVVSGGPHRPGHLRGPPARLGPDLPAGRRGRGAQRGQGPGPGGPGQHAGGHAPAGLGRRRASGCSSRPPARSTRAASTRAWWPCRPPRTCPR